MVARVDRKYIFLAVSKCPAAGQGPLEDNFFFAICPENLNDFNTYRKRQSYFIDRSEQRQISKKVLCP